MAFATFPVTYVNEAGPNARSVQYIMSIPAGTTLSTDGAYLGPVDSIPAGLMTFSVAANPSVALAITVLGSYDSPTITPSARSYFVARGDVPPTAGTDGGLNHLLNAYGVTLLGSVDLRSQARSYRFKVSTAAAAMTAALTVNVLAVKPNR